MCRQIRFYAERAQLAELVNAVEDRVVPRFEELPDYLGLTMIKSDAATRCEIVVN